MNRLRVLYVPNEAGEFRQLGFRRPLANLLSTGLVEEVSIFSLQWRIREGGDPEGHRQDLLRRVRDFRPNMLLMQHLGSTGLTESHFSAMRAACDFEFVYHEADPFSRHLHPLPRAARAAGQSADVVFTVGNGVFAENFRRAGARDVRWAASPFEPERFGIPVDSDPSTRTHDVVVVANKNRPRWRGLPNWRNRIAFVEHLQTRFGDRLAIYGRGWRGVGAMGPIDFSRQGDAIRSGWVSANWDHFADEPMYFSNRLPISLAAGSIHATTRHPGYESLFEAETNDFLIFGKTYEGLSSSIQRMLDVTSPTQRIAASIQAQRYAHREFRQDNQLVSFLNFQDVRVPPNVASQSWDLTTAPLAEV